MGNTGPYWTISNSMIGFSWRVVFEYVCQVPKYALGRAVETKSKLEMGPNVDDECAFGMVSACGDYKSSCAYLWMGFDKAAHHS